MELFDIIPDNFFSVLSSKNKRLYLACAQRAFDVYENGSIFGADRKLIVDELVLFLERNKEKYIIDNDELSEGDLFEAPEDLREVCNRVLRQLEKCGWIYSEITDDYIELINFTDYAITMLEAFMQICPTDRFFMTDDGEYYDNPMDIINPNEYQGYIYTIYSLLNSDGHDYSLIIEQVYKNAKMLLRSLRKMDSRMKDYINGVVETSEIKDLISKLMDYNTEIYEPSYQKLKTSDNINKYRLFIVTKLEEISADPMAMDMVANNYLMRYRSQGAALDRANRDIDEMVDLFNGLDEYILGIDEKNKRYINSTIGKIKFLLSEEDNVVGRINNILRYIKTQNAKSPNKGESAVNMLRDKLVNLNSVKGYSPYSLTQPRGKYQRNDYSTLDTTRLEVDTSEDYLNQFRSHYDAKYIGDIVNTQMMVNGYIKASDIVSIKSGLDDVMTVIYVLIYATDNGMIITKLTERVENEKFSLTDFIIKREEE